jgi:hypothetical protein
MAMRLVWCLEQDLGRAKVKSQTSQSSERIVAVLKDGVGAGNET